MEDKIQDIFGLKLDINQRKKSYDFIETFIETNVTDWSTAPDTEAVEIAFTETLKTLSNNELAFLLVHSGYIPEFYGHDSSQETLYSKLVESLVCEWAQRIGFSDTALQKQKSNKEDVTVKIDNNIIVCDAKSFRLGRSQKAPNVKDVIKQASYIKWLDQYEDNECRAGLVTFPSLLDWKNNSEAYQYFSDHHLPILFLFYEHLSFLLISDSFNHQTIIDLLHNYEDVFPESSRHKAAYINGLNNSLFLSPIKEVLDNFLELSALVIKEKVQHSIQRIEAKAIEVKAAIESHINAMKLEQLRAFTFEVTYENEFGQMLKQLANIKDYRPH
ncbi:HindIII family type II restriction endonuclease [uncultured Psychroserpens sp.]|uniref:HindIII family type II restriction endonuclease n=1 Tax=uncultured Psychroserpens sp. TaxID=255436 RepID=UPI002639880B|nr:HindIII family type II restriction endonuclease [uncultured Psychroserpens sp.]